MHLWVGLSLGRVELQQPRVTSSSVSFASSALLGSALSHGWGGGGGDDMFWGVDNETGKRRRRDFGRR